MDGRFCRGKQPARSYSYFRNKKEVDDCIRDTGRTPVEYLKDIGFLGPNVAAAHCVWLSDDDIRILADYGVTVIYNPVSNMKLSVGKAFPYAKIKKRVFR